MRFSSGINRPPYETADGYLQTTEGCSHNHCLFCIKFQRSKYDRVDFSEYMCYNILKATFVGCCSQLYQKSYHRKDSF